VQPVLIQRLMRAVYRSFSGIVPENIRPILERCLPVRSRFVCSFDHHAHFPEISYFFDCCDWESGIGVVEVCSKKWILFVW
jgi:hypothetical protein